MQTHEPWEHPEWYDLHDTTWTAGSEREPEHYRELVLALPPLDKDDHLVDVGAGTGKLVSLIAQGYPYLGQITLLEPNEIKLERAQERLQSENPSIQVNAFSQGVGTGISTDIKQGNIITIGSVFMPIMTLRGGTLADGLQWLRQALVDVLSLAKSDGWVYAIETLGAPWDQGGLADSVRRLNMNELTHEFVSAGLEDVECMYRFRDRIILRGRKPMK